MVEENTPPAPETQALRERLSRLSEASARINESLDFNVVLQETIDNARRLTNARYGVIATTDEAGGLDALLTSGTTEEQHDVLVTHPGGMRIFDHFSQLPAALRVENYGEYAESVGIDGQLPMTVFSGLAAPVRHRDELVGIIWLGHDRADQAFSDEDIETMVMFASQAALVIANARRHRDVQRARADLETLVNTAPVGVVVVDATTGDLVSVNQEARRLVDVLSPGQPPAELLAALTLHRADGREVSLRDFPLAEALRGGETVRGEEITLSMGEDRSLTVLLNATPIVTENGELERFVATVQDMTPLKELERLRAEFLAMVSHELRAPLTSVKGSIATLLNPSSPLNPGEVLQFHRIIDSQTDQMRELIADLLDVARIDTGTLSVAPEPTDLATLVGDAREAFQSGGGQHTLLIDLEPELPLVMADRLRMVQVLNNLLFQLGPALAGDLADPRVGRAGRDPGHRHRGRRGQRRARRPHVEPVPQVLRHHRRRPRARVRADGPGPRHLQRHRRGPRWPHLGGERGAGDRRALLVHHPHRRERRGPLGGPGRPALHSLGATR